MELHQANKTDANITSDFVENDIHSALITMLNQTSLLAREGKLREAEQLLFTLPESDQSRIEVLDLLAKIYSQQGEWEKAQQVWLRALLLEPSNLRILAALKTCACQQRPRFDQFNLRYMWLIVSISVWLIIVLFVLVGS